MNKKRTNRIDFNVKTHLLIFKIVCLAEEASSEKDPNHFTKAFDKENLSDCGINEDMLQLFCSADPNIMKSLDSVKYNSGDNTFTW